MNFYPHTARILDAPKVEYANNKLVDTRNMGQWDMRDCQFVQASNIGNDWAVVNFAKIYGRENRSSIYKPKVDGLVKSLIYDSKHKGINVSRFIDFDDLSSNRQRDWQGLAGIGTFF